MLSCELLSSSPRERSERRRGAACREHRRAVLVAERMSECVCVCVRVCACVRVCVFMFVAFSHIICTVSTHPSGTMNIIVMMVRILIPDDEGT